MREKTNKILTKIKAAVISLIVWGLFIAFTYWLFWPNNEKEQPIDEIPKIDNVNKFTGGTFDIDVFTVVTEDTIKARNIISTIYKTDSVTFNVRALTFSDPAEGSPIVVWFPNLNDKDIVLHELCHVTTAIFKWAGLELNQYTDEVFSYETQYLYNQIYKK